MIKYNALEYKSFLFSENGFRSAAYRTYPAVRQLFKGYEGAFVLIAAYSAYMPLYNFFLFGNICRSELWSLAFYDIEVKIICHRLSFYSFTSCDRFGNKYRVRYRFDRMHDFAQEPAAYILLDNGSAFTQYLVSDVAELFSVTSGGKSERAYDCARCVFLKNADSEFSCLLYAVVGEVAVVYAYCYCHGIG